MTQPIHVQSIRPNMTRRFRVAGWVHATCFAALYCGRALAEDQQGPPVDEVAISAERQNQLENESLTLSGTPNSGPHLHKTSIALGAGPLLQPVYPGSKNYNVTVFPYVDIRGLLGDRVFLADVGGIGVKILNDGPVLAGVAVTYGGGRKSSEDAHLKGLPDINNTTRVSGYVVLALRPITVEADVGRRTGSGGGTAGSLGVSYSFKPVSPLNLSLSAVVAYADAAEQNLTFGITPQAAASAAAQGNPLPAFTAHGGLNSASFVAAGVYQINRRWGVIGRFSLSDLLGSAKDSPLTQRTFGLSSFAVGAAYSF